MAGAGIAAFGQAAAMVVAQTFVVASTGAAATNAAQIKDEKVKEYLNPILTSEAAQESYLKKNGKMYKYREKVVHITGYAQ